MPNQECFATYFGQWHAFSWEKSQGTFSNRQAYDLFFMTNRHAFPDTRGKAALRSTQLKGKHLEHRTPAFCFKLCINVYAFEILGSNYMNSCLVGTYFQYILSFEAPY